MALSYVETQTTGTTTGFSVPFPYLEQAHISVTLDGVPVTFTWASPQAVEVAPAPTGLLRIARNTPTDEQLVNFLDGSVMDEDLLNLMSLQLFYGLQEVLDASEATAVEAQEAAAANAAVAQEAVEVAEGAVVVAQNAVVTAGQAVTTANASNAASSAAVAEVATAVATAAQAQADVAAAITAAQQALVAANAAVLTAGNASATANGIAAQVVTANNTANAANSTAASIAGTAQIALDKAVDALAKANEALDIQGSAGVSTFNGRNGNVVATTGDYLASQILMATGGISVAQAILDAIAAYPVKTVAGRTGDVTLAKGDVGLGNVDNTSDLNKPLSTAVTNALSVKLNYNSPSMTGTPLAPTAAEGTNSTQVATCAFVLANTPTAKATGTAPAAGVLDLSSFTGLVAKVSLTANVTSITLPPGKAGARKELVIEFTNTGAFTVAGWPTSPTLRIESKAAAPVGHGNGVVTQYALSNTDDSGWLMHGNSIGFGQAVLRVPSGQRQVASATGGSALSTLALVAARAHYVPFTVPRPMTLSALGVSVSTAAAGTGTLGIYDSDGDATYDYPGTLLASSTTGAINTGTTGTKLASVDITLIPGHVYFAGLVNSSAATVRAVALAGIQPLLGFTDNSTTAITMLTTASTTNVLPTTPGAPTVQVTAIPAIYLVEVL